MSVYLYLMKRTGLLKIGISKDPPGRARALSCAAGETVLVIATQEFPTRDGARSQEVALHHRFKTFRQRGEWFRDSPEIRAEFGVAVEPADAPDGQTPQGVRVRFSPLATLPTPPRAAGTEGVRTVRDLLSCWLEEERKEKGEGAIAALRERACLVAGTIGDVDLECVTSNTTWAHTMARRRAGGGHQVRRELRLLNAAWLWGYGKGIVSTTSAPAAYPAGQP